MRGFHFLPFLLGALCAPLSLSAQLFDAYLDTTVADVYVTIDQARLDSLWSRDPYSDYEYLCKVKMVQNGIADSVPNAGFRFRGNTSRVSKKKSFKVSINTFTKGQRLLGYKDFNLNGEHNDPSLVRAKIVWEMFNRAGLPATRSRHVRLWVNGTYYGIYLSVEHVNDDFLVRRFGNESGNLYKCLYPADLTYRSENPDDYKFTRSGTERTYDLKTNEEFDDYADLASFISFLNKSSDTDFANRVEERFNVDGFLRYLAVSMLSGNWDNYWYLKNNFYLYNNPASGRFEFLPYDVDNTLGVDWIGRDWATRNMYSWGHESEPRPLATRILAVPRFKDRYSYYADIFRPLFANADTVSKWGAAAQKRIRTAVLADPYYPLDYGYSGVSFDGSMSTAQGGHVKYGIQLFMQTRHGRVDQQITRGTVTPFVRDIQKTTVFAGRSYTWRVVPGGAQAVDSVFVHVTENGSTQRIAGIRETSGIGFLITVPAKQGNHTLRIEMKDAAGVQGWWPSPSAFFTHTVQPVQVSTLYPLRLNEFLADNAKGITDEAGDREDWVEIINTSAEAVNLAGFYLTDNLTNPGKWAFPSQSLAGNAFALIYADEEATEGPLHAAFKLSRGGEALGLFYKDGTQFILVDSVKFGAQTTDVSSARIPDATGNWQPDATPTPGQTNGTGTRAEDTFQPEVLALSSYPNPFNGRAVVQFNLPEAAAVTLRMVDLNGRTVQTLIQNKSLGAGRQSAAFFADNLSSGVYLLVLQAGTRAASRKLVLVK
jgi:hypothetical protein